MKLVEILKNLEELEKMRMITQKFDLKLESKKYCLIDERKIYYWSPCLNPVGNSHFNN